MADIHTLKDDFADNSINTAKWDVTEGAGGTCTETGGKLELEISSVGDYVVVDSDNTYSLTGSHFFADMGTVPSGSNFGAEAILMIDSGNLLRTYVEDGTLYFGYKVGGSGTTVASVAYNSTTHRYWRIRESGGTCYWDTSADGISWTNRGSVSNPITVTALQVEFVIYCWDTLPSTQTMQIGAVGMRGVVATKNGVAMMDVPNIENIEIISGVTI